MRRTDREIRDFQEIVDILDACDTIRLGMRGKEYPYVLPLSFGYAVQDGQITLYVHGAKEGFKHDCLAEDPRVCVEADRFLGYATTKQGVTAQYDSVIGFGVARVATREEAAHGLDLLLQHCGFTQYSGADCVARDITRVYKIRLEQVTGKRRRV